MKHDDQTCAAENIADVDIVLFGETRCHKTRFYQAALEERGLNYELAEVDHNPEAARRLVTLAGSDRKFPTFAIKGRKLRNPKLPELDKRLARAGLHDPGLVHDEQKQRFIRHMEPTDAWVDYQWRGDTMVLWHIEVSSTLRGTGIGARFAAEVFNHLLDAEQPILITCSFMRKVAASKEKWAAKFLG